VRASTVVAQVDVKTLKVVAKFPSQSEAERQTGIPRTNIRRYLRQGRSLGDTFGDLYGCKTPDFSALIVGFHIPQC
jgi:hypothetical protein